MNAQFPVLTAVFASLLAVSSFSTTARAAGTISSYLPSSAKPGDSVKIKGTQFPTRGKKNVVYGTGNRILGQVPAVSNWTSTRILVNLPTSMPAGKYWLGVANRKGQLRFKGRRSLVVTGSQTPPRPPAPRLDISGQGTVLDQSPKRLDGALLKYIQVMPDLAITGFAGYPVATIGDTVTLRAVIQNRTGGPSALPHYLFHYGKGGKVERSRAFKVSPDNKIFQVATSVYIDPKKVSAQGSILYFKNLFWIGTSQDTAPYLFKDVDNSNNQRQMTMLAKRP